MNKTIICSVAIVTIGVLEALALMNGINGTYLALSIGAIGTIVGFIFGKKF